MKDRRAGKCGRLINLCERGRLVMIFFWQQHFPRAKDSPKLVLVLMVFLPGGQSPSSDPPTKAKSRAHTIAGRKITSMMKVQKHFFSLLLSIAFSHGLFSNLYDATKKRNACCSYFFFSALGGSLLLLPPTFFASSAPFCPLYISQLALLFSQSVHRVSVASFLKREKEKKVWLKEEVP